MEEKFAIGLGITPACNMKCPFCYSIERRNDNLELPIEDWMNFFEKNSGLIKDINFGTGENTLVDDWFKLVDYINNLSPDISQALTTNGSLAQIVAKDKQKDKIIQKSLSDIDVSLDYAIESKHNAFRGHNNAFKMAIDTLAYSQDCGFNNTLVVMGIDDTLTIENLDGIFDIAKKYDTLVRVNIYRPVNKNNGLEPPSLKTLLNMFDYVSDEHEICSLSDPLFNSTLSKQKIKKDPSGTSSLRIIPNGSIYPSTYLISKEFEIGTIYDENILSNVGDNPIIKELTNTVPSYCGSCEKVETCAGGTIDRRILWHETVDKPDPYCPSLHNLPVQLRDYKINTANFSSIHDGYLPTIFFRPKKVENE